MVMVTAEIGEGALTQQAQITAVHQADAQGGGRRQARSSGAPRLPDRPQSFLHPRKPHPKEGGLRWNTQASTLPLRLELPMRNPTDKEVEQERILRR